jgi:TP901 family phage tail tape measure protein
MVIRELVTKMGFKIDKTKMKAFESRVDGMKNKAAKAASKWGVFGEAIAGGITKLDASTILIGAATVALAGLIKGLTAATEKYLEFERGMKGVERVTLATAEEMERMENAALEAGEASIFTTGDAANAMKFLAQAGLDTNQTIEALPGALQLAAAAEMDLATAADISTNVLTANQLKVSELTRVNDVLAKAASKTNTDVVQLGWAFAELGNIAQMSGLEIEESAAFMGVLANNGIRGTAAGTTFKNAMIALLSPTKKGSALLQNLNINMANYVDETGKWRKGGLPAVFGELNKAYKEGRVGIGTLTQAFGKLPAKGIATFAATGRKEIESLTQTFYDSAGTAEKAANIAFKGLDGAVRLFESKMDVAAVRLIKDTGLKNLFEDVVRFFGDIVPPLVDSLSILLKPIVLLVRALLFPFKLIGVLIGGFIKSFNSVGKILQGGFLYPIERFVGLLDSVVDKAREFMDVLTDTKEGPLKEIFVFVNDIFRIFKTLINFLIAGFKLFFEVFSMAIGSLLETLGPFIAMIITPIKKIFSEIAWVVSAVADLLEIELKAFEQMGTRGAVGATKEAGETYKTNIFNIDAPVSVAGGRGAAGTAAAVKKAVVSQFSIELQKIVIESGGV